jgi:exodeoxyribonuclease-3
MQIVSWNLNGIRSACNLDKAKPWPGFLDWLREASPDVLCVQETKAEPGQLSDEIKSPVDNAGRPFKSWWSSAKKRGYSGTAIYTKTEPDKIATFGIDEFDNEGRFLAADYGNVTIISAYFPNSQEAGARLPYKLRFCDAVYDYCKKLEKKGRHFVLCGDYNIAHKPIDLAHPESNEGNPGYLPEERAWMDKFTGDKIGVDIFRHFYPDKKDAYSWWSYRTHARARNVGWRIDYTCVDPALVPQVKKSVILADVQGSDHCPVSITVETK